MMRKEINNVTANRFRIVDYKSGKRLLYFATELSQIANIQNEFDRRLQALEDLTQALLRAQAERDEMKSDLDRLSQNLKQANGGACEQSQNKRRKQMEMLSARLVEKKAQLSQLEGDVRQGIDELSTMRTEKQAPPTDSTLDFNNILQKLNISVDCESISTDTRESTHKRKQKHNQ
ncbi:hypothetical protein Ciccas_013887, partial [Cichlidogyrus casuarinus]